MAEDVVAYLDKESTVGSILKGTNSTPIDLRYLSIREFYEHKKIIETKEQMEWRHERQLRLIPNR